MQPEITYFVVFVLITAAAILLLWRLFRAANSTLQDLSNESRRDRLEYERIMREKYRQAQALRRGTRKVNGRHRNVNWDQSGRRAHRSYHVDEAFDEVFDLPTDDRGMDFLTPWGWPAPQGYRNLASYRHPKSRRSGFKHSVAQFFRKRQLVDDEFRARRQRSIRALVEDRYGRVGYAPQMQEVEWSRPDVTTKLVEERQTDQMLARTAPGLNVEPGAPELTSIRLVSNDEKEVTEPKKASGG